MPGRVEIVPLEFNDQELLIAISAAVRQVFSLEACIGQPQLLPTGAHEPRRGQYHATKIIEHLSKSAAEYFRRLGVTSVDLFVPIMRYVFGEAMLGGRAAVVSVHRLGLANIDKSPAERTIFYQRTVKEAVHELGHTFDLTHCNNPTCVMTSSLDVVHIDVKSFSLCFYCQVALSDGLEKAGRRV